MSPATCRASTGNEEFLLGHIDATCFTLAPRKTLQAHVAQRLKVASILKDLNQLDQPLSQHVNRAAQHAKTLASLKIVDARQLLQAITEFQKENLAHKLALKHLVAEVESLSRSSKDATLHQRLANIRGLSTNLNNKLDALHVDLEKGKASALKQMNEPGRTDDPNGSSPLTDIIGMILQITALLIKRRKATAK